MRKCKSPISFAFALVAMTPCGAASPKSQGQTLEGNSSYVSQEAPKGVRSRIDVQGLQFQMKAISRNPRTGEDGHHGGSFSSIESRDSYRLRNIGIIIPKEGVTEWADELGTCERLELTSNTYAAACTSRLGDAFTYVISKSRGVLSFTGHCLLTEKQLCNYVLITEKGIAAP